MRKSFIVLSCFTVFGCSEPMSIKLTNPDTASLVEQPMVIEREVFGVQFDEYLIFSTNEDQSVPAQFDDIDGDGKWDEVALQLSFEPKSTVELAYQIVTKSELPEFESRTAIHFGYSPERNNVFSPVSENVRPSDHVAQSKPYIYQFEGPGWESELIAYRLYFDSRNGKDIFGKTRPELMLKNIGLGENYHELQEWGMDVLKVGSSLGSGGLAMLKNDSIYRLTETDKATFQIVTQGPLRSILKLSYEGWKVDGSTYDLTETISIWAGKRHFQSDVALSGNGSDTLVTGIVNLHELESEFAKRNGAEIMYTHGIQSENMDVLGMGLIIPKNSFISFGEAPKEGQGVTNTYTALMRSNNGVYQFGFYTGWELENSTFSDEATFVDKLKAETYLLTSSIEITQ